jgi:hypothetical protein
MPAYTYKKHWMPTREAWIKDHLQDKPNNLVIRFSAPMVNQRAPASWPNSSEVVNSNASCPAPKQNNECRDCRHAGTPQLKLLVMESIKEFPRGINSDQVISKEPATTVGITACILVRA